MLSIDLLKNEWHPIKNGDLLIEKLKRGSDVRVWWQCPKNHEWDTQYKLRATRGDGCPYCSGRYVIVGENDLATLNPALASEWNFEKNHPLTPQQVKTSSHNRAWWVCNEKHEWEAIISSRKASGCPYCAGKRTIVGVTDLATTHPELIKEWDSQKNKKDITEFSSGSDHKAWWIGICGHSWQSTISNRVKGKRCRYCLNRELLIGFNDLATTHPDLANEWDIEKNSFPASECLVGSRIKAHWVCKDEHRWEAWVYSRTGGTKRGCKLCIKPKRKSLAETELVEFLQQLKLEIKTSDRGILGGKELDIFLPEKKIAIEYNGVYWHSEAVRKEKDYHYDKWSKCKAKGIELIQIWEDDWKNRPELVKNLLVHRLGIAKQLDIQQITVTEITEGEARVFLDDYHLQGHAAGSHYLGLKDSNNVLASVMVLQPEPKTTGRVFQILRFAAHADRSFAKFMSYIELKLNIVEITVLSDHCFPTDDFYRTNGFEMIQEISPDYMYLQVNKRVPKTDYPLKRFRDDSSLEWKDGASRRNLEEMNKLYRVWDAGMTRWNKLLGTDHG